MKPLLLLLLAVFALDLRAIPSTRPNGGDAEALLGEWYYLEPGETGHSTLLFEPGGRFKGSYVLNQGVVVRFYGRWSFKDDKIYYRYEWCSHPMDTKEGSDTIIELTAKTLITLEGRGPSKKVYRKITK